MMLDKILRYFGLMRIEKARHFHRETVAFLTRTFAEYARQDFGIPPSEIAEAANREKADIWFDEMLKVVDDPLPIALQGAWENA